MKDPLHVIFEEGQLQQLIASAIESSVEEDNPSLKLVIENRLDFSDDFEDVDSRHCLPNW